MIGTATVTRPEGILFQIKVGDPVFQGDVIETTADGWVSIRFYDGMVFNLSSSARMALKNFPDGGTSQPAVFDVARGDFIFSSGKMAKAGRLEINTPVASIRGRTQFGGIGTLSLISLFFAALEKVQASPSNTTYTDDELLPLDYTSEPHGSFELVTKETVPRHFFVADPGVTWSFRLSSSSELSVSQIANSPARMEQLHAIQQNVLQTYSVGLQAMQGPTVHGPNGSTTNPNFEALPGGARPINFQPDSESAQSLTTASLGVTNSSSGASKTSGATTPVSDSSATSLTLDSIFVPPALPPLAPPSAPAAPVITTTAPAQNSASSIDIAGIAKVNSTVTLFNNGSTVGTATADSGGHWSVPGVALSSGLDYTFTATATDATGTSAPSTALSFHDSQAALATVTALSADTGTAGDFITSVAAQTVSGSYSGTLGAGEKIQVSVDGTTWIDATAGAGTWSASGVTLAAGAGTLSVRSIDAANNTTAGTGHSYTLDATPPSETFPTVTLTSDSGASNSDFITSAGGVHFAGTVADTGGAGIASVQVFNGSTLLGTATVVAGNWTLDTTLAAGTYNNLKVTVTDLAGNASSTANAQTIIVDATPPSAVATVTALSADTGTAGDFITSVAAQTVSGSYSGTLGAGEKIQVSVDGTTWIDATAGAGTWSAIGVTLVGGRRHAVGAQH